MSFYELKKYLQYRLRAKDEHHVHSPFVFKLYTEVINAKNNTREFIELNKIRQQLVKDETVLTITDLGAGSKKLGNKRTISEIAKYSVIQKKYGELLFRIIEYFKPRHILELGTSLGLSTLYMAKANEDSEIISVEGCAETFAFAKKITQSEKNIQVINTSFDEALEIKLTDKNFDLVYIDGNHTYKSTIKYFSDLLKLTNERTVLIFDDVYWSEEMTRAWQEIKKHPKVTVSIDLYKLGLIFFRKENKQKEHFCLKY